MSEEFDKNLAEILELVTNDIVCEILSKDKRHGSYPNQIRRRFDEQISTDFAKILCDAVCASDFKEALDEIATIFGDFTCVRGFFKVEYPKRKSRPLIDKLSIDDYRYKMYSEIVRILLDSNLTDVDREGENGNTILHLVVSLPTETKAALELKIKLLGLLIDAEADCSLKNAEEMSPLDIIAGNYLFDPQNSYFLSTRSGLTDEYSTKGRFGTLQALVPIMNVPCMDRGRHGNSILHEWVIYSSSLETLSTEEIKIGKFIISHANVPLSFANDYNCTALHFAFSTSVLQFLCQHKSDPDTARLNARGDNPVLHIVKYGILAQLAVLVHSSTGVEFEELSQGTEMDINFTSQSNNNRRSVASTDPPSFASFLQIFENNGFNVAALDDKGKSCLDYLQLFLGTLFTRCKETFHRIPDSILSSLLRGIELLTRNDGAFDDKNCREGTIYCLVHVLFEVRTTDTSIERMLVDCIRRLFESGADPNKINCPEDILSYCCARSLQDYSLKKELVQLLCENGARTNSKPRDDELQNIIKNTKLKRQVAIQICSERYRNELDELSREVHPERFDVCEAFRFCTKPIGKGAIGAVFLAINESAKREVAMKRIDKTSFTKEIKAEIQALTGLEQNQNVINFYDLRETKVFDYLEIELMDGDLRDLVTNKKLQSLLNDPGLMRKLAADVLGGLEFLHKKGMVHRDIKPGNILYRELKIDEKSPLILKLADFDLTKCLDIPDCERSTVLTTNTSSLCGTRGWMAPEIISRKIKSPTKDTDIFALGLVFHFMFSKGFHPFHSKTVSLLDTLTRDEFQPHTLEWSIFKNEVQVHHSLGDEQIHLVNMLLRNDPKQRPCSDGLLKTHCYFWSNLKKREFICKVGEQPEVAAPQKCPSSNFENNVNGSTFGKQFRAVSGWNTAISDVLYREISRRRAYDTSSVTELIRFYRNAYAHLEEQQSDCRTEIFDDLNNKVFQRFPEFLVTVWMEVMSQGWADKMSSNSRDKIRTVIYDMD